LERNRRATYEANMNNNPPPYNRAVMDEVFVSNNTTKHSTITKFNPMLLCRSVVNVVKTNRREKAWKKSR
jgi:hypothetical protein